MEREELSNAERWANEYAEDHERILETREAAVKTLLQTIEPDITREGLLETPRRVARMYDEVFGGYFMDPAQILSKDFEADGYKDLVLVRDIEFWSFCEHHMAPFFGVVHIAYLPEDRVIGLSKLARLVDCFARRLQIQERMTSQIADAIETYLKPKGVAVVVSGTHTCMTARGAKTPTASAVTSAMRGVFLSSPEARSEVLSLIELKPRGR